MAVDLGLLAEPAVVVFALIVDEGIVVVVPAALEASEQLAPVPGELVALAAVEFEWVVAVAVAAEFEFELELELELEPEGPMEINKYRACTQKIPTGAVPRAA